MELLLEEGPATSGTRRRSDVAAGLGLLRAEFARRFAATQVWVPSFDGARIDCCIVPPLARAAPADGAASAPPSPSPSSGCCRRGVGADEAPTAARPVATVLFFAPNAVLYESFGMAPVDGASWVATSRGGVASSVLAFAVGFERTISAETRTSWRRRRRGLSRGDDATLRGTRRVPYE